MGLTVCVGIKQKPDWFFKRKKSLKDVLENIGFFVKRYAQKKGIDFLCSVEMDNDRMNVGIHPSEEYMEFSIRGEYLVCEAKTSSAGPGYHAFVVSLLEAMEKELDLIVDWENEDEGFEDETGYYRLRDFSKLQKAMCYHLSALAKLICSLKDEDSIQRISLPYSLRIEGPHFSASPMGFWEKSFFEEIASLDSDDIDRQASLFFPWWKAELDADFWKNVGLVQMWTDIKWHPPLENGDDISTSLLNTLQCFEMAKQLNPAIELPTEEIEEIQHLLSEDEVYTPKSGLIGFHRGDMRRPLMGDWSVILPGYFYEFTDDEEGIIVYFHGKEMLKSQTLSLNEDEASDFMKDEELKKKSLKTFSFNKDGTLGKAYLIQNAEDNDYTFMCKLAAQGSCCYAEITMEDINQLDNAVHIFESIKDISQKSAYPANDGHPIPLESMEKIDMITVQHDGTVVLTIVSHGYLDSSRHTRERILEKVDLYFSFANDEEFLNEFAAPSPEKTHIELLCSVEPHPSIITLVNSLKESATSHNVSVSLKYAA